MKKLLAGLFFILFALNIQAQWYNKQFGVNDINDLSELQLNLAMQKANKNLKTGKILTFTGLGVGLIGTVVAGHAAAREAGETIAGIFTLSNNSDDHKTGIVAGELLMFGGLGAMTVGIPLWAVNSSRRNKIEIALIKFNFSSYLGQYQPTYIGFKQLELIGLGLKIKF